jgi:integrase
VVARVDGKQRRIAVGTFAVYPKVDDARDRARELLQVIAMGGDPTAKAETVAPRQVDTVRAVCGTFIERYAKVRYRSWKNTEAMLANHLLPTLGDRDIRTVTRADVRDLLDRLADNGMGIGVNRVLATLRKLFSWALDRDYIERSPAEGLKAPAVEIDRDRWLSDNEVFRVWIAAAGIGDIACALIRTLLLTGQRRSEVAAMKWAEIDLEKQVWTLPREKAKNDEEHDIPLSPQVLTVLTALPRIGPFVFPGRRSCRGGQPVDVPVSGFSKLKATLDQKIETPPPAGEPMPMRPWRLHDLRRTAGTHMSKLGIASGTISKVMNHAEAGVTKRYVRHGFMDEKRVALETWGRKVESLIQAPPAAVGTKRLKAEVEA